MRCYLFVALFICAVFGPVQSVPVSDWMRSAETQHCLDSLRLTAKTVQFLGELYNKTCSSEGAETSTICEFAWKTMQKYPAASDAVSALSESLQADEVPSFSDSSDSSDVYSPAGYPVFLNVYNLFETHPFIKVLKCVEPNFDSDTLYHTSISYRGEEFYYGFDGISTVRDGKSSFGSERTPVFLGFEHMSRGEMRQFVHTLSKLARFTPKKYNLFTHNCNVFTKEASWFLFHKQIDPSYQQTVTKLANTPLGRFINLFQSKLRFVGWLLNSINLYDAFDSVSLYACFNYFVWRFLKFEINENFPLNWTPSLFSFKVQIFQSEFEGSSSAGSSELWLVSWPISFWRAVEAKLA